MREFLWVNGNLGGKFDGNGNKNVFGTECDGICYAKMGRHGNEKPIPAYLLLVCDTPHGRRFVPNHFVT